MRAVPVLENRLVHRELGYHSRFSSVKGLYGDQQWVEDLDIVNELGGHTGCVNALSWSKSGKLLASGSDDQHLNIYSYQPDSSCKPFVLTTTVATGHTANIFSVKFMPHSNDRTLVTCAGDAQIRVFDIEYSGRTSVPSAAANLASARRNGGTRTVYQDIHHLSDGNTNARVYRSHSDRVKRIVTESSPYLFLSCSEDGDVRQWDLRLPSSAYPPPRSRRDSSNAPPPLISYKRYQLDLNTISCSANQPHYIVLGGTHLHCFLHDRRMLGRDMLEERGVPRNIKSANRLSDREDDLMNEATRCVRRFAPNGQDKMRRTDNGHVTACKISDANPNEMVASWSGEHIYSFDLVKSPDARATTATNEENDGANKRNGKVKESNDRKGKRKHTDSPTSAESLPRNAPQPSRSSDVALRIRYDNGQTEDISIDGPSTGSHEVMSAGDTQESNLSNTQQRSLRIARSVLKIRKLMLSLDSSTRSEGVHTKAISYFSSALYEASSCLAEIDQVIREWRYPVSPTPLDLVIQKGLRHDRDSTRRFVQAAGTLARVLGGKMRTAAGNSPFLRDFEEITLSPNEGPCDDVGQIFSYEFLKAIVLWLEGGRDKLLHGFMRQPDQRVDNPRLPVPPHAAESDIEDYVIPYLLGMAGDRAILNVDASRFENDETRVLFSSEIAAVNAFTNAIKISAKDISKAVVPASSSADDPATSVSKAPEQDKEAAMTHWGSQVGRGLLLNASRVTGKFSRLDQAFGGSGGLNIDHEEGRVQDEVYLDETEPQEQETIMESEQEEIDEDESIILVEDLHNELAEQMENDTFSADEDVEDDLDNDEDDDDDDDDYDDDDEDSDGDITTEERQHMWQGASERGKLRESVQTNVPCVSHTRVYKGHCNVKTVKDVNFYGLQDEYVVSGSDSGHLFIWDRKTTQLLNILEGDGEVVNVVQGHPYEPLLAVSGIDNTIKIFSPDHRARHNARHGIDLGTTFFDRSANTSSVRSPFGRRPPDHPSNRPTVDELMNHAAEDTDNEDSGDDVVIMGEVVGREGEGGLRSAKRIHQEYRIVADNDRERQGGMRDAIITRRVLAQLAAGIYARRAGPGGAGVDTDEGRELLFWMRIV